MSTPVVANDASNEVRPTCRARLGSPPCGAEHARAPIACHSFAQFLSLRVQGRVLSPSPRSQAYGAPVLGAVAPRIAARATVSIVERSFARTLSTAAGALPRSYSPPLLRVRVPRTRRCRLDDQGARHGRQHHERHRRAVDEECVSGDERRLPCAATRLRWPSNRTSTCTHRRRRRLCRRRRHPGGAGDGQGGR